jgi:hypothetical protein
LLDVQFLTPLYLDSGRFAQPDKRAAVTAARLVGESGPNFADFVMQRSLLDEVRTFFKDNPGWE